MGRVANQSMTTIVSSYIGVVIGYINLLFLFPKFLSPDQIGLFKAVQSVAMVMVPFAQMGLNNTLVKYFSAFNKKPGGKHSFLTMMLIWGMSSYLIFLFIFSIFREPLSQLFAANAPEVIQYFNLVLILVLVSTINGIMDAYSRSLLKILAPNFIRDIILRLMTTVIILLYAGEYITFDDMIMSLAVIYAMSLIILAGYLGFLGEVKLKRSIRFPEGVTFRNILNFSLFSVVGAGGSIIVLSIDTVMVTTMLGLEAVGIYTIVFFIALVIELPKRAVSQIASPMIANHFEYGRLDMIGDFYKKAANNQLLFGSLIFIGIMTSLDQLFLLIPNGAVYATGKTVVLLIAISRIIDMMTSVNSEIITMSKHYRFNVVLLATLAILTVVNNIWLIPIYGIDGAAGATLLTYVIFNAIKLWFVWYKFKIHPFSKPMVGSFLLFLGLWFGGSFLEFGFGPIIEILLRSLIVAVIFAGIVIGFKLSPEGRGFIEELLQKAKIRKN